MQYKVSCHIQALPWETIVETPELAVVSLCEHLPKKIYEKLSYVDRYLLRNKRLSVHLVPPT